MVLYLPTHPISNRDRGPMENPFATAINYNNIIILYTSIIINNLVNDLDRYILFLSIYV